MEDATTPYPIRPARKGLAAFMRRLVRPERAFYQVCLTYGTAVSLLSLAVPVAVQMVINTVANTAQQLSLLVVCGLVVGMLTIASALYALQIYSMELFCRRFFARTVAEMSVLMVDVFRAAARRVQAHEVIKRFYEIIFVQEAIPHLVISGFALAVQMMVGLIVVAFYHPFLLAFNLVFIFLCLVIWRIWHAAARDAAREVAAAKYDMAGWLGAFADSLSNASDAECVRGWQHTNHLTNAYLNARKSFFGCSFAQTLGYLLLYITASAGLLGLGGWLVIKAQLTLGQLAAAEIILSAVFFSLTRVGYFLGLYYELCVAAEKLDAVFADPIAVLAAPEGGAAHA